MAVAAVVGLAVAGVMVGISSRDDEVTRAPVDGTGPGPSTVGARPPVDVTSAFPAAALRLLDAGSFRYSGRASATDVSLVRPMLWLAVDVRITGEVELDQGLVHEIAVSEDERAAETLARGGEVWGRRADDVGALADGQYQVVPELSGDGAPGLRGVARLPGWLAAAVEPSTVGTDRSGRHTFAARLPAGALGAVERGAGPIDGRITLTVAGDGTPLAIEVVTVQGPAFHLSVDISDLGRPIAVATPA